MAYKQFKFIGDRDYFNRELSVELTKGKTYIVDDQHDLIKIIDDFWEENKFDYETYESMFEGEEYCLIKKRLFNEKNFIEVL